MDRTATQSTGTRLNMKNNGNEAGRIKERAQHTGVSQPDKIKFSTLFLRQWDWFYDLPMPL